MTFLTIWDPPPNEGEASPLERARRGKALHEMETVKIMPCLDMKEGRVVKGIHFVDTSL